MSGSDIFIILSGSASQRRLWPPRPRGFLIKHDTPQSVGLLWTSDQLVTEASTWQHTTDKHPCPRWDSNPWCSRRAAVDLHLRPRSHGPAVICLQSCNNYLATDLFLQENCSLLGYYAAISGNFYWRFGTSRSIFRVQVYKMYEISTTRYVITQNSAVLVYFMAEALNHVYSTTLCELYFSIHNLVYTVLS
jgi:hypothetical protein